MYALENDIPIDASYYVENQLSKPLKRIFKAILKDPNILFEGAHMRSIIKVFFVLFYFILFYFILFYFILFYFILFYFILFYY